MCLLCALGGSAVKKRSADETDAADITDFDEAPEKRYFGRSKYYVNGQSASGTTFKRDC
ncbi:hypothetical protein [Owenweeksia hongkongensis]|uniref:hypothetical protein n=1 Tax=Owenweeksia hongkongensis TaxID=253245 RepID=UPI003A8E7284